MNAEIFRNLLDRHTWFTTPRNTHNVVTELSGIGLRHNDILPAHPPGQANSDVTYTCSRPDRELGLVFEPDKKPGRPTVRAYVRRWRDIIDENKRRLDFVTSSLEFDPSLAEGLAFIREEYSELIPDNLAAGEEPDGGVTRSEEMRDDI